MGDYSLNLKKAKDVSAKTKNKYTFLFHAIDGDVSEECLNLLLTAAKRRESECDFHIIKLIRLLFLGNDQYSSIISAKEKIIDALDSFPFWPKTAKTCKDSNNIIFWSENHILMMLSSRYLFKQWKNNRKYRNQSVLTHLDASVDTESKLLLKYLEAHCSKSFNGTQNDSTDLNNIIQGGVYEVNSHVYLPYTMSALLNLYDFADDARLKQCSLHLLNIIVYQLMLCTTPLNGVCNLSGILFAFK